MDVRFDIKKAQRNGTRVGIAAYLALLAIWFGLDLELSQFVSDATLIPLLLLATLLSISVIGIVRARFVMAAKRAHCAKHGHLVQSLALPAGQPGFCARCMRFVDDEH